MYRGRVHPEGDARTRRAMQSGFSCKSSEVGRQQEASAPITLHESLSLRPSLEGFRTELRRRRNVGPIGAVLDAPLVPRFFALCPSAYYGYESTHHIVPHLQSNNLPRW